jgi:DNA-binding protein HU-beta
LLFVNRVRRARKFFSARAFSQRLKKHALTSPRGLTPVGTRLLNHFEVIASTPRRTNTVTTNSRIEIRHTGGLSVNKTEIIDHIAGHADISKAAAGRALDAAVTAIKTAMKRGGMVTLVGFGTFYVGKREARSGRNPRTGAEIRIKAAKVPKFRAGKALKDAVN